MTAAVRVHVVTYRRPVLLERALRSLMAQTRTDWVAEVLNDAPDDPRPGELVRKLGDDRIVMGDTPAGRGGAFQFNRAFRILDEPYSSILEDDNWWDPEFLECMTGALEQFPGVEMVCGNERIWREEPGGGWTDTGTTIWPEGREPELFPWRDIDKCGGAKLCNSSLLFRTRHAAAWRTPDGIPIDVTEHFRERAVPHPFLVHPRVLVNYAETLTTGRSRGPGLWGEYQVLLLTSLFSSVAPSGRSSLARALWERARREQPQSITVLLGASLAHPSCRMLGAFASPLEWARFAASSLRHPVASFRSLTSRFRHPGDWKYLADTTARNRPPS